MRNFIRALWVLASIISAAGCAHVEILSTRIADLDSKHLVVEIVTSKDLRQFDHTYFADHVYLSYRAENTSVSSEFKHPGRQWAYPFSVDVSESLACGLRRFCSRWSIPVSNSSNLDLNKYEYVLRKGDNLPLRIDGGSMGGGRLKSNVVIVKVPQL